MPEIIGLSKSIFGFDPRSLGGCVLWLDGADATTLFSDTGGTPGSNSIVTGPVRRWKDKSGLSNDFSNRSYPGRFPIYASGGGVFISNASTPFYNSTTFNCLESVNSFMTFPYYTIYTVVNATAPGTGNQPGLPTLFTSVRNRANVESRSPYWGMGGHFSLGSPTYSASNSRFSFGNTTGNSAGEQISNLVTTVAGLTSGRLSNTTSLAGTRVASTGNINYTPWTTCTAPPTIGASFYLYDAGTPDQTWLNGTIFETLVFNSELTRMQCEELEGYLSWKWGRQTALPTTHPFRNIAPLARGFTPIDIPGCQLWLDAADASSVTGTTTVTAWRDKSGNDRNLGVGSGTTSYASNSITLANSYMFVTSGTVNLTAFTFFIVAKSNASTNNQPVFTARPNNSFGFNSTDGFAFYMDFQTTVRFYGQWTTASTLSTNSVTTSTPAIFSYTSEPGILNAWINGASRTGATSQPSRTSTAQGFAIGAEWNGSSYNFVNGTPSIYEIIVYNTSLTNVQRQAVEGYLAWKWNLNTSLSTSNILRSFPPSSVQQFKPTDINACSLWLDAADISTDSMTFSSGSNISVWKDKSGNGSNATANTPIAIVSGFGGNTVLSTTAGTGTNQWLLGNISIRGTGLTVISAFRMESSSGLAARIIGLAAPGVDDYSSSAYVGILRQTNNNMGAFRAFNHAAPTFTYGVPAISTSVFDGAIAVSTINGGTSTALFLSSGNFGISAYAVLANTNTIDAQYFTGQMGEMIVYNSTLTFAQRQQVEGYLSKKWNIPLATTHPYYAINPAHVVGGTGIITPSNLPGLLVWNRGDTLAVGNGNTINTWTNSTNASGPTITCTGTQSNSQLNGLSVANLLSTQTWTSATALTPSSYTFIQVLRQTPSTYGRVFQSSVAGTNHLHGYWGGLKQPWYTEGWLGVAGGGIGSAANEWAIISSTRIQNGAFQNRWNGAVVAQGSSSPNFNLGGLAVNTGGQPTERSTCQIAEVILYSNVLTNPQIIGIEEYLRQKWGLGLN